MLYTAGSAAGEHLTAALQQGGLADVPDYNSDDDGADALPAFVASQQTTLADGVQAHVRSMLTDALLAALSPDSSDTQPLTDATNSLYDQWTGQSGESDYASQLSGDWTDLGWNHGQWDAATQVDSSGDYGIQRTWRSVHGPHTRPEHAEADGQTVGLYDNFSVGGEDLMYPADPSGSAAMTYNCECYLEYDVTGNVSASVADDLIANSE